MNDFILKSYVDKLSINHIKEYAKKNNIVLKNNEDEIIYDYIKKYWYFQALFALCSLRSADTTYFAFAARTASSS